jgi:hypothetical protein
VVITGEEVDIYYVLPFGEAPQGSPHTAQSSEGTPGQFYRLRLAERTRVQTDETASPTQPDSQHQSDQCGSHRASTPDCLGPAGRDSRVPTRPLADSDAAGGHAGEQLAADRRGLDTLRQQVQGTWSEARLQACLPRLRRFLVSSPRRRRHQESAVRAWLAFRAATRPGQQQIA